MATCSALFGATHGDYDRARPCANVVKFKNGEHACSFNVLTAQNGARTPRCDGMRDQVLESGVTSWQRKDVVGRPELVTPVRRSLLLLAFDAFPGPVLGSARVHKCVAPHTHTHTHERAQTTEHFHLHARTQFQAPSSHKEHRGSSAPRSSIAATCAHADSEAVEGWRSNCPACTSTRERLAQHSRAEEGEIEPTLLAARTLCRERRWVHRRSGRRCS